jgi:hypothetical protein
LPLGQDVAVTERAATGRLLDAVALWEVGSVDGADVISAAVDALVAGLDSSSLRELAGASAKESRWTLRPLVEATLDELGETYPGPGTDEIQIAAARVMCERLLQGSVSARELATWAYSTIGHEGAARLQPFVQLDDAYDFNEYAGDTPEDLEDVARRAAESLLAGEPLPVGTWLSQPDETAAPAGAESRFRSALRRARTRLRR